MIDLLRRDEGIGVVTALMVAFILFTLGATWYSISLHELDEVTFDRHRTQAVHAADAGAREGMYLLSSPDDTVRTAANGSGEWTSSTVGGTCDFVTLTTTVDGSVETVGEYWIRITDATPSDTEDLRYLIESWGWSPHHAARQADAKKVELEVLLTRASGFEYGLFGAGGGISANNRKEIYGNIYSGSDASISNHTQIYDNGVFPGDGNLDVYGNLTVPTGSDLYIEGRTTTNGYIDDRHPGDNFIGDVIAVEDGPGLDVDGNDAFFADAVIGGVVRLGGTLAPSSDVNGAAVVENATGLEPVPLRTLPDFTWDPADYDPAEPIDTYSSWSNFSSWYTSNKTNLRGAHYVQADPSTTWNLEGAKFAKDFILVVDGDLNVRGKPTATATAETPVSVIVVGNQAHSDIATTTGFESNENVHFVFYSKGTYAAKQLSVIYGAVYAESDVSNQKLILHYRQPELTILKGFSFMDEYLDVQPGVWREVPTGVDDIGIVDPDGSPGPHYCTYP